VILEVFMVESGTLDVSVRTGGLVAGTYSRQDLLDDPAGGIGIGSPGQYVFDVHAGNSIPLSAGVPYWVVARAESGKFYWSMTAANNNYGEGSAFVSTRAWSVQGDSSWVKVDSGGTLMMQVYSEDAVPEPGTFLLVVPFGALALYLRRRLA
jgi:hypothetical protein